MRLYILLFFSLMISLQSVGNAGNISAKEINSEVSKSVELANEIMTYAKLLRNIVSLDEQKEIHNRFPELTSAFENGARLEYFTYIFGWAGIYCNLMPEPGSHCFDEAKEKVPNHRVLYTIPLPEDEETHTGRVVNLPKNHRVENWTFPAFDKHGEEDEEIEI